MSLFFVKLLMLISSYIASIKLKLLRMHILSLHLRNIPKKKPLIQTPLYQYPGGNPGEKRAQIGKI